MTIELDFQNKTILLKGYTKVSEFLDKMRELNLTYKEWTIKPNIEYIQYPINPIPYGITHTPNSGGVTCTIVTDNTSGIINNNNLLWTN